MKEEEVYVEEARELATLLQKTLSSLLASKDMDSLFASIIKSNAVIILKDEDKNLYAYWTLKRTARISDVKYVKSAITEIPRKYKSWFTPGEEISLKENTKEYVITAQIKTSVATGRVVSQKIVHTRYRITRIDVPLQYGNQNDRYCQGLRCIIIGVFYKLTSHSKEYSYVWTVFASCLYLSVLHNSLKLASSLFIEYPYKVP